MSLLNNEFLLFLKCAQKCSLRYLVIGGYAVNFHGYNRNTNDLDIWLAPTNENKVAFIQTLLCMNYSPDEVAPIEEQDFTGSFMGKIGTESTRIDVLTVVHRAISFDTAEKGKHAFEIVPGVFMQVVPYDALVDIKLRSERPRDLHDIEMLEKIRKGSE